MTDMRAWLDQGKTLADQATEGPWAVDGPGTPGPDDCLTVGPNGGGIVAYVQPSWDDAAFIADARSRLPQALDALQAVLDLHKRNVYGACTSCVQNRYPCPTVRAITDAIGGGDE